MVFQGFSIQDFLNVTVNGFSLDLVAARGIDTSQILPEISKLLNRGGLSSMYDIMMIMIFAMGLGGMLDAFQKKAPDLCILDIMMPGMDGLTVCTQIRKTSHVPIIIVSAKDSPLDRIQNEGIR